MSCKLPDGGVGLPQAPLTGVSAVPVEDVEGGGAVVSDIYRSPVDDALCVLSHDIALLSKHLSDLFKKIDPSLCKGRNDVGFSRVIRCDNDSAVVNAIYDRSDLVREMVSTVDDVLERCQL